MLDMTVKDLEKKRDEAFYSSQKDLVRAIYNVGIAIVEALNSDVEYDGSIFEPVFGKKK